MSDPVDTNELPDVQAEFAGEYPQVWAAYNRMGNAIAAAGPLDERTQRLTGACSRQASGP